MRNINTGKLAFKQMENINSFLEFCYSIGVSRAELFQTVDLYEKHNMGQVCPSARSTGRARPAAPENAPAGCAGARSSVAHGRKQGAVLDPRRPQAVGAAQAQL